MSFQIIILSIYTILKIKKIKGEVIIICKNHIIQTPNKYFFIKHHNILHFLQYFPEKIQYIILTKTKLSRLKSDKMFAKKHLNEIRLLTLNEMKEIFPKSKNITKDFLECQGRLQQTILKLMAY